MPMRAAYKYMQAIPTRWMDNDVYGHVTTWSITAILTR